jgi:hypothetical protein
MRSAGARMTAMNDHRPRPPRTCLLLVGALICWGAWTGPDIRAEAETFLIACGKTVESLRLCHQSVNRWLNQDGHRTHRVILLPLPFDSAAEHSALTMIDRSEYFAEHKIDLFEVDIIDIPGFVASHNNNHLNLLNLDVPLKDPLLPDPVKARLGRRIKQLESEKHFGNIAAAAKIDKNYFALPYFADIPILYQRRHFTASLLKNLEYNKGLPAFLESVVAAQNKHNKKPSPAIYAFETRASESVIANFFEWAFSDHALNANNENELYSEFKKALTSPRFRQVMTNLYKIDKYNRDNLVAQRDESDAVYYFSKKMAATMRNWPFAYHELELVSKNKAGLASEVETVNLPLSDPKAALVGGTLGGWYIGINKMSYEEGNNRAKKKRQSETERCSCWTSSSI